MKSLNERQKDRENRAAEVEAERDMVADIHKQQLDNTGASIETDESAEVEREKNAQKVQKALEKEKASVVNPFQTVAAK